MYTNDVIQKMRRQTPYKTRKETKEGQGQGPCEKLKVKIRDLRYGKLKKGEALRSHSKAYCTNHTYIYFSGVGTQKRLLAFLRFFCFHGLS